ncbi:MAG TPA: hypothetical protein VFR11_05270 [Micromonosporaceae bacterium]|jgi:hypothetical protein|nr:hypothetical protein [Micromonosporaceae bacterium]
MTTAETDPDGVADAAVGTDASDETAATEGGSNGASWRSTMHITELAVGTAVIASEQVRGGARAVGGRAAAVFVGIAVKTRERTDRAREMLTIAIDDAERRGRDTIASRRQGASGLVDATIDDALAWAQVKVLPKFIDDLVPHLISDVMPKLIDGALPDIRDRVVPVIIDDLTTDSRVQELILNQSRGVLGQLADQLRTNTVRADERLEAAARRVVARNDKGTVAKGLNDIRGV